MLATSTDDEVLEIVQEEIEEHWDEEWLIETDKASDAIHRCLSDGTLDVAAGTRPCNLAVLGGKQIHAGEDYIIALVTPDEVEQVSTSLAVLDEAWLRERYEDIDPSDYRGSKSSKDFEYTFEYFKLLAPFFSRTAKAGRYVIFTVDP